MALFDQFGPAQANNGQAPPSPQTTFGAPGFPSGSWGNQPPNMAGGLQQFLASRGMAQPQPGGMQTNGPMQPQAPQQPGMIGAPVQAGGVPQPVQNVPAAVMPQGASATSPTGNFASQMQPFLGARR